jgi:hypothetical protein
VFLLIPTVNGTPLYGTRASAALGTSYGVTYPTRLAANAAGRALGVPYVLGLVPKARGTPVVVTAVLRAAGTLTLLAFSNGTYGLTVATPPALGAYRAYASSYPYLTLTALGARAA